MKEYRQLTKIVRNMELYKNKVSPHEFSGTEYECIRYIVKHPAISQIELAQYLNVDKSLVTRIVSKLEKNDFITIAQSKVDKRTKEIYPTEKAKTLKTEFEDEELDFYNSVFNVLDTKEQDVFLPLLNKIYLESKRMRKEKFQGIRHEK